MGNEASTGVFIFFNQNPDDKAIHFIQAEKLYYENALISTEEIQKKLGKYFVTHFFVVGAKLVLGYKTIAQHVRTLPHVHVPTRQHMLTAVPLDCSL